MTSAPKEQPLDLDKLVADLAKERDRLGRAISALLGSAVRPCLAAGRRSESAGPRAATTKKRKRGGLTPEGSKRLVDCDEEALGRAQEERRLATARTARSRTLAELWRSASYAIGGRRFRCGSFFL